MELNQPGQSADSAAHSAPLQPNASFEELWSRYEKCSTPGYFHKVLSRLEGTWKVRMDFDYFGYGPNYVAKGLLRNTLMYEGRFLQMKLSMEFAEQSYEGTGFYGYDNGSSVFTYHHFDNHNTGFLMTEGKWLERQQMLVEKGTMSNPMLGGRHLVHTTRRFVTNDQVLYHLMVPKLDGTMCLSMVAQYDRLKTGA